MGCKKNCGGRGRNDLWFTNKYFYSFYT